MASESAIDALNDALNRLHFSVVRHACEDLRPRVTAGQPAPDTLSLAVAQDDEIEAEIRDAIEVRGGEPDLTGTYDILAASSWNYIVVRRLALNLASALKAEAKLFEAIAKARAGDDDDAVELIQRVAKQKKAQAKAFNELAKTAATS